MIRIDLTSDIPIQFKCKTGDTFKFDGLDFWEDAAKTIPLDITVDEFRLLVLDSEGNTVITFSGADFVISNTQHLAIVVDAGRMDLDVTPAGQPHSFFWEWTRDSDGKVTTIGTGQFIIEAKDANH